MKLAFIVHSERCGSRVTRLLAASNIDYYTRWEHAPGAGHETQPRVGAARALGGFGDKNCVLMIAFQDEAPLAALLKDITVANTQAKRADERIRVFVLPLETIV